jgi:hypothetical protein
LVPQTGHLRWRGARSGREPTRRSLLAIIFGRRNAPRCFLVLLPCGSVFVRATIIVRHSLAVSFRSLELAAAPETHALVLGPAGPLLRVDVRELKQVQVRI